MNSIEELERQRAERHRLIDAEFDERIRRIAHDRAQSIIDSWPDWKRNYFISSKLEPPDSDFSEIKLLIPSKKEKEVMKEIAEKLKAQYAESYNARKDEGEDGD